MVGPRTRSQSSISTGTKNIYGSVSNASKTIVSQTTTDVTGYPHLCNYFYSTKTTVNGGHVIGKIVSAGIGTRIWDNYPDSLAIGSSLLAVPSPDFTDQAAFNHAVATANPSRADVQSLAFIAELRELPKLYHLAVGIDNFMQTIGRVSKFKHQIDGATDAQWVLEQLKPTLGNGIHHSRKLAVANVTLQFGVVPMIADIKSMLGVMMNIERRRREINQLYSGRGLRRKINFGSMPSRRRSWRKTWCTMRWRPDNPLAAAPLDTELWRTMMGLTPSHVASAAWELLPWTWFMDYFSNTGDVIAGLNNAMSAHMFMGAIMHETVQTKSHGSAIITNSGGSVNLTRGVLKVHTKMRSPMNLVSAAPSIPILSGNQLSILSSLVLMGK